jgi:hypothetical protein
MKIKINKQAILEETSGLISAAIPVAKRMYIGDKISKADQHQLNELKKDESFLTFKPSDSYSMWGNVKTGLKYPLAVGAMLGGAVAAGDAMTDIPDDVMGTAYGAAAGTTIGLGVTGAGAGALTHVIGNRGGKTYQQALAERQAELNKK